MDNRIRIVVTSCAAFLALSVSPWPASAQFCGLVDYWCNPEGGSSYHNFDQKANPDPARGPHPEGVPAGYHGTCMACTINGSVEGDPADCHPLCVPEEEDQEKDEQLRILFAELVDESAPGQVVRVLKAAARLPDYSYVNEARRSLQIMGCDGTIVANLPLGRFFDYAVTKLDRAAVNQPTQRDG